MTIQTIKAIIYRAKTASTKSKIAVFKIKRGRNVFLDAVFESTFTTKERIKAKDRNYIGSYDSEDSKDFILNELSAATNV